MRLILLALLFPLVICEEGPPAHMLFAQRLMSTLPELPNAIQGGMEGRNDGLKSMISSVLGDGLISQLVVNPIGVAEEVLPDLGLNKTEVMENLDAMSHGMASNLRSNTSSSGTGGSLFGKGSNLLSLLTTTQKTTTEPQMLVDGVAVDFDEFIRKNKLEGQFKTKLPPKTTPAPPTSEKIAEEVLSKLENRMGNRQPMFAGPQHVNDFASTMNMAMVDPRRVAEVNQILRRAPQKFDTLDPLGGASFDSMLGGPPGYQRQQPAALDPAIDEVVTNLRTRGADGMNVEDIRRLKDILRTYEETLQTKEFIAKRNQLQVLQTELEEHRKRIDMQKRMENELRKKEQELETQRTKMEAQLREQLSTWNLTFENQGPNIMNPIDLPELNPAAYPSLVHSPGPSSPVSTSFVQQQTEETPIPVVATTEAVQTRPPTTTMRPRPPTTQSSRSQLRFAPRGATSARAAQITVPTSTSIAKDDDEPTSTCDCIPINIEKMKGSWVVALASKSMLAKMYEKLSDLLQTDAPSALTCSRLEVSSAKRSSQSQEARINWFFKTQGADNLNELMGSAVSTDHATLNIQMYDFEGDIFSAPLCMLKTSSGSRNYEYMVVVDSEGPCNEAALLVRNPDQFFDKNNEQLVQYLKTKISKKELEQMDMVSFANDCESE